jgi:hypothetical protein
MRRERHKTQQEERSITVRYISGYTGAHKTGSTTLHCVVQYRIDGTAYRHIHHNRKNGPSLWDTLAQR